MEPNKINLEELTSDELLKYTENNVKRMKELKKSIEDLEFAEKIAKENENRTETITIGRYDENPRDLQKMFAYEKLVSTYVKLIDEDENTPLPNDVNLLLRLKLEIISCSSNLDNLIDECISENDLELIKEIDNLLIEVQRRMNRIESKLDEIRGINNEIEDNKEEANLIFAKTSSGNVRAINELKKMPAEFYPGFKKLFQNLKHKRFNNIKTFLNNNHLTNINEIRGFQIRIIYDILSSNNIAVVSAFIKKCNNDKGYLTAIERKASEYKREKNLIKSKLNDENFIKENKEYEEILFNILNNGKENEKTI